MRTVSHCLAHAQHLTALQLPLSAFTECWPNRQWGIASSGVSDVIIECVHRTVSALRCSSAKPMAQRVQDMKVKVVPYNALEVVTIK